MRIGLDLRWLEQAYRDSPIGAIGGIGTFSRNLWLGLARAFPEVELVALVSRKRVLPKAFIDLIRVAPRHVVQPFGLEGLNPVWSRRGKIRAMLRLLESELGIGVVLRDLRLDVFHILDHTPPRRRPPYPVVATIYDLSGWKESNGARNLIDALVRWGFAKLIRRARVLVPISYATQKDLQNCFPRRRGPFPVIRCSIEQEVFRQSEVALTSAPPKQRLALPGPYFLHVGVLTQRKNPAGLIRAMARVIRANHPGISLLCVGPYQVNPGAHERVMQLAREHGIEPFVRVVGDVSPEDLACLYRQALGLVFPSFEEGFGLPALECLACGTPCVVSQITSLPEAVGEYGILVDPSNPEDIAKGMLRLLEDYKYRAMIAAQGPVWARQFSPEAMAINYMDIYRSLA